MRADADNVLAAPVVLPSRALLGSAAGKAFEALTLAGFLLLLPRALGAADYGAFAVALAVATGISTATGIGGPALFARALGPLSSERRRALGRTMLRRLGAVRASVVAVLVVVGAIGVVRAPGSVSALQIGLVVAAVGLGTAATLLSQLALGLRRTAAWSLRYPLENGVIVIGVLVLYPLAGLDGALAAIALGAAAALALGLATAGRAIGGAAASDERLAADVLHFARLQAMGGALTQAVHRGAAPACALLGVGAAATGHAAIAAGAALAITYAVMHTTLVALPGAVHAFAGGDRAGAEAALRRVATLAAMVVVPGCVLLALAAEPLLAAGLGEGFREAAQPLRIALAAAALAPLWALSTQLAALRGQPEAVLAGAAGGAATFTAVAAFALPGRGASAAAMAMLAGIAATSLGTGGALRLGRSSPAHLREQPEAWSPSDPPPVEREQQALPPQIAGAAHSRGDTPNADQDATRGGFASGPGISVVVVTRDRPAALERCLLALTRQTAAAEVVVIDDGSTDPAGVAEAVSRSGVRARIVAGAGRGPAAARNLGARAAGGAVICFTDDDCEPRPQWAQRLADACRDGGAAAGTTVADPAAGRAAAASQLITHALQMDSLDPASGLLGFAPACNLACHADILREVAFDESYPLAAGEDRDWCSRIGAAGVRLRFVEHATVVHSPRLAAAGLLRQHLRYGRGAVRFRAADADRRLAGRSFYTRLAWAIARGGPATAALVVLAHGAGITGAACEILASRLRSGREQRRSGEAVHVHAADGGDGSGDVGQPRLAARRSQR